MGLRDLIFAEGGTLGLAPEFLQNLLAEGIGTIFGIVISVAIAVWLDRQREKNRHVEHRGRAVTRWVKNHTDMLDGLVVEVTHGAGAVHRARATALVRETERNAGDIKADYASALRRSAINSAFGDYIRSLNNIAAIFILDTTDPVQLDAVLKTSTSALEKLVRAAGARRSILQTEPVFGGLPAELQTTRHPA